ncbi:MAG: hypothetical protein IPK82_41005 [Polyangiaceae bacterium]|nr:hypothetical protein [Polyangiaceae bacterium]
MIPVAEADEPASFDKNVRQKGLRAIAEMVGKEPAVRRRGGQPFRKIADREEDIPTDALPDYWVDALDDLMEKYNRVCAYSCFRIHPVTGASSVDHFAAKSRSWDRVYEWSNYRLCSSLLNARKSDFGDVLDPFEVGQGWFHLELLGFQVVPNPALPVTQNRAVQATIDRLRLNDFRRDRERDAERYWARDYSLRVLKEESPFVAYELYRQGRLNAGDQW